MHRVPATLLIVSVLGCSQSPGPSIPADDPAAAARGYVSGWDQMGMWLPNDQVPFFAKHLDEVQGVLTGALSETSEHVRLRAAFVIERIGPAAVSLEAALAERIEAEPSRVVRIYLYDALRSIGAQKASTLAALERRFHQLRESADSRDSGDTYTAVDERIYAAAALYVLDQPSECRAEYCDLVLQWLRPTPDDLAPDERETYWDHRWCAVNAVEHMHGAKAAIPLLDGMLSEKNRRAWVSVHVPRALRALRAGDAP